MRDESIPIRIASYIYHQSFPVSFLWFGGLMCLVHIGTKNKVKDTSAKETELRNRQRRLFKIIITAFRPEGPASVIIIWKGIDTKYNSLHNILQGE